MQVIPQKVIHKSLRTTSVVEVIEQHRMITQTQSMVHCGWTFTIDPGVFSPFIAPSGCLSLAFPSSLIVKGRSVLDVGCGSGVTACLSALNGASKVVGIDISSHAIQNANKNREATCADLDVTFLEGDLFAPLYAGETFDVIFADLPLMNRQPKDDIEAIFYDPGYRSARLFLQQASNWLSDDCPEVYFCCSDLDIEIDQIIIESAVGLTLRPFVEFDLGWTRMRMLRSSQL